MLVFGAIVFLAFTVQATCGFGASVVCLTLGAHLFPISRLLVVFLPLSVVQCTYLVLRHRGGIDRRLLLARVLPLMGAGMVLAPWLVRDVDAPWITTAFGVFVLLLAVWELRAGSSDERPALSPIGSGAALVGAGFVHGLFATGGPLLVYTLGRRGLSKHTFRSTVIAVWLTMNVVLCVRFGLEGRFDRSALETSLFLLPVLPLGILLGEQLHRRLDEAKFRRVVFALLAVSALALIAR